MSKIPPEFRQAIREGCGVDRQEVSDGLIVRHGAEGVVNEGWGWFKVRIESVRAARFFLL